MVLFTFISPSVIVVLYRAESCLRKMAIVQVIKAFKIFKTVLLPSLLLRDKATPLLENNSMENLCDGLLSTCIVHFNRHGLLLRSERKERAAT